MSYLHAWWRRVREPTAGAVGYIARCSPRLQPAQQKEQLVFGARCSLRQPVGQAAQAGWSGHEDS